MVSSLSSSCPSSTISAMRRRTRWRSRSGDASGSSREEASQASAIMTSAGLAGLRARTAVAEGGIELARRRRRGDAPSTRRRRRAASRGAAPRCPPPPGAASTGAPPATPVLDVATHPLGARLRRQVGEPVLAAGVLDEGRRVRPLPEVVEVGAHPGQQRVGADGLRAGLGERPGHHRVVPGPGGLDDELLQRRVVQAGQVAQPQVARQPEDPLEQRHQDHHRERQQDRAGEEGCHRAPPPGPGEGPRTGPSRRRASRPPPAPPAAPPPPGRPATRGGAAGRGRAGARRRPTPA